MVDTLLQIGSYAPVFIFIASVVDIFFATGLFLYGAATLSAVFILYTSGVISLETIVIASYSGTIVGNCINYGIGRVFSHHEFVQRQVRRASIQQVQLFFTQHSLFPFILISRFIAVTRPLYAIVLGTLHISFRRFIVYEAIIAFGWVVFWLVLLLQGANLYQFLFT